MLDIGYWILDDDVCGHPPSSNKQQQASDNSQATTSKIQVVVVPLQVPDTVSEWGGREPRETTSS